MNSSGQYTISVRYKTNLNLAPDFLKYGCALSNFLSFAKASATFSWAFNVWMWSAPRDFLNVIQKIYKTIKEMND